MASLVTCMAQSVRNNHMYTSRRGEYEGKLNVILILLDNFGKSYTTYTPLSASLSPFWLLSMAILIFS